METLTEFDIRGIRGSMSLEAFAALLGSSTATVFYWEKGTHSPKGPAQRLLILLRDEKDGRIRKMLEGMAFPDWVHKKY